MAFAVVAILRRFDGMFENQKSFLKKLGKIREEKMSRDELGDEPIEMDEDALSNLQKDDGLY